MSLLCRHRISHSQRQQYPVHNPVHAEPRGGDGSLQKALRSAYGIAMQI